MRYRPLFAVIAVVSCMGLATAARSEPLQEITYLLPAPPSLPAFAPWMLAQQRGYYSDEGLKVTFLAGKGGADVAKQVGAGNVPMGGGVGDTPIIVRPNGVPVRAVAVLGGSSLMHLAVNKSSGIDSVAGLKGRIVGAMSYADTTYYALLGMMKANGLEKTAVNVQASGPSVWQSFADNKLVALASVPEWTVSARDAGIDVLVIPADRYFKSMAQAIIASDDTIRNKPELVGKFVRATLRGMKDILADPHAATVDYVKAVPAYAGREKYVEEVLRLYNDTVYKGQARAGEIDRDRVASLQSFYLKEGIIGKESSLDELFTNQFIPTK